ncbi:Exonuclease [Carpediemonas membranifera]|uniref:Exonuclease n=1 Tax=Carpediemonas membranifera TaxID=201153 RepID=A0A8J6E2I0_9EUKA|nr:Exonuclease [Carpediemonas membranifera]|eukprot:KAG9394718.1 Exonuclease [Carpediemonas membranifera]
MQPKQWSQMVFNIPFRNTFQRLPMMTCAEIDEIVGLLWTGWTNGTVIALMPDMRSVYCRFSVGNSVVRTLVPASDGILVVTQNAIEHYSFGGVGGKSISCPGIIACTRIPGTPTVVTATLGELCSLINTETGKTTMRLPSTYGVTSLASTSEYILTGHTDGRVTVFPTANPRPVSGAVIHPGPIGKLAVVSAAPLTFAATGQFPHSPVPAPLVLMGQLVQGQIVVLPPVRTMAPPAGLGNVHDGLAVPCVDGSVLVLSRQQPHSPTLQLPPIMPMVAQATVSACGADLIAVASPVTPQLMLYTTGAMRSQVPTPAALGVKARRPVQASWGVADPIPCPLNPLPERLARMPPPKKVGTKALSRTVWRGSVGTYQEPRVDRSKQPPPHYRLQLADFDRVATGAFDFDASNQTTLCGLERTSDTAFVNAILQMLYAITPLRHSLHSHGLCDTELCFTCELSCALDGMATCSHFHCSNLLRAMRLHPAADQAGFGTSHFPLPQRVTSCLLFLLNHVDTAVDSISDLLGIQYDSKITCAGCGTVVDKSSTVNSVEFDPMNPTELSTSIRTIQHVCHVCGGLKQAEVVKKAANHPPFILLTVGEWQKRPIQRTLSVAGEEYAILASASVVHQQFPSGIIPSHTIAHVLSPDGWVACNDFTLTKVTETEVLQVAPWRQPFALVYQRRSTDPVSMPCSPLVPPHPGPELACIPAGANLGIDMEFVLIGGELSHFNSDGDRVIDKLPETALARVTVVKEDGTPIIDDKIAAVEPVVDYVTRFSGIVAGDLQAGKPDVLSLKQVFSKIKTLRDMGVIFIGHGLDSDFRVLNLGVRSDQIIDTVKIAHLPGKRRLALRYLAKALLGRDIQVGNHDSLEDAVSAVDVYHEIVRLREAGEWEKRLERLYEDGPSQSWGKV